MFSHLTPYLARVVENYELHQPLSERSCRHIEFEISSDKVNYETGDHLGIMPSNDVKTVEKIGRLLNTNLDQVIELVDFEDGIVFESFFVVDQGFWKKIFSDQKEGPPMIFHHISHW